jgi:hypothetical protein
MTDNYKPYKSWWEDETNLETFIKNLKTHLGTFEDNMVLLNKDTIRSNREDWMSLFLLWMEYKK